MARSATRLLRAVAICSLAPLVAWSLASILLTGAHGLAPHGLRWLAGVCFVLLLVACGWKFDFRGAALAILAACLVVLAGWSRVRPSNDREWSSEQSRLPWAEIDGSRVTLHDVRDFRYRSATDRDENWYDAVFDTDELEGSDYFIVSLSEGRGAAHTMVSFRFQGDRFVTFSAEVRKETGESFGILGGLFRQFELTFVVADERDAVQLRTHIWGDRVHLYRATGSKKQQVAVFMDLVSRVNQLHSEPEFYNTLTNNCLTNLVLPWERINGRKLPRDHRIVFSGYSDELAYEYGIIEHWGSFESTRARALISDLALEPGPDEGFSQRIRARSAGVPPQ